MSEPTAARRLFFALWPTASERAALLATAAAVLHGCGGRRVPPQNLHVTLLFLGQVPAARAALVSELGRVASTQLSASELPLRVQLSRLAHFEDAAVLVVLPQQDVQGLLSLAAALRAGAGVADWRLDVRPFRPHVTLARGVRQAPVPEALAPVDWQFDEFALIESRSARGGSLYSVLETYPLGRGAKVCALPAN